MRRGVAELGRGRVTPRFNSGLELPPGPVGLRSGAPDRAMLAPHRTARPRRSSSRWRWADSGVVQDSKEDRNEHQG